jgi:exopolyphosphatase / guanosine-5'-triphosphate,3'-diphosphate pyrophosphatase
MRLGVLDMGSNTIHLQVVDAHPGARPTPASSQKFELRLTEYLDINNQITDEGFDLLNHAITEVLKHAEEFKCEEILAFATSAIREAENGQAIIEKLQKIHEIDLQILSGDEEAQLTFLAVRRWMGWSAGRLLVLDIGGGSLEMAVGNDESASSTLSLPIGAARMTREHLSGDPYTAKSIKSLSQFVRETISQNVGGELLEHEADRYVATSKTFRTLARLTDYWYKDGGKTLEHSALVAAIEKLKDLSNAQRADLPGVSASRARQLLAGAIVAESVMKHLKIDEVEICPWALREGIVLKWLDWMGQ